MEPIRYEACNLQELLNDFIEKYPIELILEKISKNSTSSMVNQNGALISDPDYMFLEELKYLFSKANQIICNQNLQNCNFNQSNNPKNLKTVVNFLTQSIPISFIFSDLSHQDHIELTIVLDQLRYKTRDEIETIMSFVMLGNENINCSIYSFSTIQDFLCRGHIYFSSLCIPKNCIYQNTPLNSLPKLELSKVKLIIENANLSFTQHMNKANAFLKGAIKFANDNEFNLAYFMVQQACELSFQSLLQNLRGKKIKSHELTILRKHTSKFAPSIKGIFHPRESKEVKILKDLQEGYIESRYNDNYKISEHQLNHSLSATKTLISECTNIFTKHCQNLNDYTQLIA